MSNPNMNAVETGTVTHFQATRYDGSLEHNLLLTEWYCALVISMDLDLILMRSTHTVDKFIDWFRHCAVLYFDVDAHRIVRAVWFEPVMSGAYMSVWLAREHRRTKSSAQWVRQMAKSALDKVQVLLAITKQEKLVELFEHFGFRLLGRVPRIWDGEDVWAFTMTKEDLWAEAAGRAEALIRSM